jgi:hypothetical protein
MLSCPTVVVLATASVLALHGADVAFTCVVVVVRTLYLPAALPPNLFCRRKFKNTELEGAFDPKFFEQSGWHHHNLLRQPIDV